jgi:membrane protease YdiL (CAAX protease family)
LKTFAPPPQEEPTGTEHRPGPRLSDEATDDRRGAREALLATVGLLAALAVGKPLARATGLGDVIFTAIAAYHLYVPLWLVQRAGESPESHAIHAHGVLLGPFAALRSVVVQSRRHGRRGRARGKRQGQGLRQGLLGPLSRFLAHYGRGARLRGHGFLEDVGRAVVLGALTFPLFFVGHHVWQGMLGRSFAGAEMPGELAVVLLKNTFLIALPEELFYRGFVEHRLERRWPTRRFVLGIPVGRAVIVTAALFALGHFLGEWNPARLGPFFPAFLFSFLVRRSGSISGAVCFHGLSNAFSYLVASWYR